MPRLENKKVVITGASSGIGFAAARAFARAGADVAVMARNREGLERAAEVARAQGARAFVVPVDLTDRTAVERAVAEAAEQLGGIDVLVSNAAATVFGSFGEVDPDDFDRVTAITYTGAVNVIRAALPELERSEGAIVATGSVMTRVPLPTFSSYAGAKHALRGFLGTLREELRAERSPVTVSMVHPGPVDTPLWRHVTSANGRLPRTPPMAYSPAKLADALVAAAVNRRAERTVGLDSRAIELLFATARPVADLVLVGVHHWYSSSDRPAGAPGSLWQPTGDGHATGGLVGRPSLRGLLRLVSSPLSALNIAGRPGEASVPAGEANGNGTGPTGNGTDPSRTRARAAASGSGKSNGTGRSTAGRRKQRRSGTARPRSGGSGNAAASGSAKAGANGAARTGANGSRSGSGRRSPRTSRASNPTASR